MRAGLLALSVSLVGATAHGQLGPGVEPLPPPSEAAPELADARRRLPGCRGEPGRERVEAAKGLHTAATYLFAEERYLEARSRWAEAYALDCTAHRLLLNLASAEQRLGDERRAWQLRALYLERVGRERDPEIAAQVDRERPQHPDRRMRWRSGLEVDTSLWPSTGEGTTFSLVGSGRLRRRDLLLELELPFAWWLSGPPLVEATGRADDDVRASLGNPSLGAHYVYEWLDGGFRAGGRVGAPLGAIDDPDWQATALRAGDGEAWRRLGRWAAGTVPISAASALDVRLAGPLALLADGEATIFLPTTRGHGIFADDRVAVSLEARVGLELLAPLGGHDAFGGGAAGQIAWLPTLEGENEQAAVDVWATYQRERFFVRLGSLWALDAPLGWATERGKVLTIRLGSGGSFD